MKNWMIAIAAIVVAGAALLVTQPGFVDAFRTGFDAGYQRQSLKQTFESKYGPLTDSELNLLTSAATQACVYLNDNPSIEELTKDMMDSNIVLEEAAFLIATATMYVCPEHKDLI